MHGTDWDHCACRAQRNLVRSLAGGLIPVAAIAADRAHVDLITADYDPDARQQGSPVEPNRLDVDFSTLIKKVESLAIERGMAVRPDQ